MLIWQKLDFYIVTMKEQHCTMFVANNGHNYDVIMELASYFHQGSPIHAVSNGTFGCRKLKVNGR